MNGVSAFEGPNLIIDSFIHKCVSKLTISGAVWVTSHFPNQRGNIVYSKLRDKLKWTLQRDSYIFILENVFENVVCEVAAISCRSQSVKWKWAIFCPECPSKVFSRSYISMMTSSNGNIFRVTGPLCGEFTGPGEFPTQRPVTRSFDVNFDLRLNKRLSKQPWGWWFETLSWSLWRQCNATWIL